MDLAFKIPFHFGGRELIDAAQDWLMPLLLTFRHYEILLKKSFVTISLFYSEFKIGDLRTILPAKCSDTFSLILFVEGKCMQHLCKVLY